MQSYLQYLFQTYILKSTNPHFLLLKQELLHHKTIDLTKSNLLRHLQSSNPSNKQNNQSPAANQVVQILTLLLSKSVLKYSASNCIVQLSVPNVLIYQRFSKFIAFVERYLHKEAAQFVKDFLIQNVENGVGFPILYDKTKLTQLFVNRTSQKDQTSNENDKKKQIKSKAHQSQTSNQSQPQYNYHKLIYQYKSRQKVNHDESAQSSKQKSKNKMSQQKNTNTDFQEYMLNIEQLTNLLQASKTLQVFNQRLSAKQKKLLKILTAYNLRLNVPICNQHSKQVIQYQKLQQHIYQKLSTQCVLLYNLIKYQFAQCSRKNPLITQKQLSKLTLLDILQTRKSLNQLIQIGYVSFYYQNARTIVYRISGLEKLRDQFVEQLAKGLVRLMVYEEGLLRDVERQDNKAKQQVVRVQAEIHKLDDFLLLFGF